MPKPLEGVWNMYPDGERQVDADGVERIVLRPVGQRKLEKTQEPGAIPSPDSDTQGIPIQKPEGVAAFMNHVEKTGLEKQAEVLADDAYNELRDYFGALYYGKGAEVARGRARPFPVKHEIITLLRLAEIPKPDFDDVDTCAEFAAWLWDYRDKRAVTEALERSYLAALRENPAAF